jgi:hypothetical protein
MEPRETSPVYKMEIRYQVGMAPKVRVRSPQLDMRVKHLYEDGTLCLYWPEEWRWGKNCLIAETIVPWAAVWLYYYELWLDTGEWLGPSSPHGLPKEQKGAVGDH